MKNIEELPAGNLFTLDNCRFIKTIDFRNRKNNTEFNCINIDNGTPNWIPGNKQITILDLYYRDTEGNILPL